MEAEMEYRISDEYEDGVIKFNPTDIGDKYDIWWEVGVKNQKDNTRFRLARCHV